MEFNERDNEEPIEGQENQNTETQNNLAEKAYNDIKDTEQGVKDGVNLAKNVCATKRFIYISLMIISFFCAVVLDISAMLIILVCLGIGII